MTTHKHLKAKIRARMATTGERYVTARRHVLQSPATDGHSDRGYRLRGGVHPDSAALSNVLAHRGVELSEPMTLGIGGGLGAGYILWEFEMRRQERTVVVGFRQAWQYPQRWVEGTLERLGIPYATHATGSGRKAADQLNEALSAGSPALAWIDSQVIGYWRLPAFRQCHSGYPVTVYAQAGERFHVDDRNLAPLTVSADVLAAARARVPSYRHQLIVPAPKDPLEPTRLREAVREGLRSQVEHLSQRSDSFSLPAWRKWSRMLTDTRNAKAWPRVFADGRGLAGALLDAYQGIEPLGLEGGHLRGLYADFLDEASEALEEPVLATLSKDWRAVGAQWHELAEATLPRTVPEFAALRDDLSAVFEAVVADGDSGVEEAGSAAARLWGLRDRLNDGVDFDPAPVLSDLSERLAEIYSAEVKALRRLSEVVARL